MCGTCGCGTEEHGPVLTMLDPDQKNTHQGHHHHHHGDHHHHSHHKHDHDHQHSHHHHSHEVELEKNILDQNQLLAERNRGYFMAKNITAINLVSSPGSGKTSVLEYLLKNLPKGQKAYVIEGDQQTTNDAERIKASGAKVVQINTGNGCHLDAHMIIHAVQELKPEDNSLLFIENVGNLVCPSMFDLGETYRMVVVSTTEGDDKPLKYPNMFDTSHICLINKIDLAPYLDTDVEVLKNNAKKVNPKLEFFEVSATKGLGMEKVFERISNTVNQV